MENKFNKTNFQGTGWDHFRARDLHKKKIKNNINKIETSKPSEKNNKVFSWIAETLNPLNHLPVVSSVKNFLIKSEKSLDIIQSAVGGFLFAGPLGILKGIGSWAANKVTTNIISSDSDEVVSSKSLNKNINNLENDNKKNKIDKNDIISSNSYIKNIIENTKFTSDKKASSFKALESYSQVYNNKKNKININV